jgi:hypothetical protein
MSTARKQKATLRTGRDRLTIVDPEPATPPRPGALRDFTCDVGPRAGLSVQSHTEAKIESYSLRGRSSVYVTASLGDAPDNGPDCVHLTVYGDGQKLHNSFTIRHLLGTKGAPRGAP